MKQLCRKSPWVALLVLLFICNCPSGNATSVVMPTDTELIVNSRLIVTGVVESVICAWDDSGSMIWTYVEVTTDRVLKGQANERTIVLKQLGGTVGESGMRVCGQAEFTVGERVLLYLNSAPDGTIHSAHNFIGKFSVVRDSFGTEFVERTATGGNVELLSRADDNVTNRARFDDYVEKIERTLRDESARVAGIDFARSGEPLLVVPPEYARKRKQASGFIPQFVLFGGGVRWMQADSGQAVTYYVNPNGSPIAGGAASELARAMSAWSNQSGAGIRLQSGGSTGSCGISVDNVNTISFGDCLGQLDPPVGACAGVVALTAATWTRDFRVIGGVTFSSLMEADTVFNKGMDCFLSTSANLAEVACHELGHSIGLAHPPDTSAIMFATAHGHGRDATLGSDDIAGVLAIYPASPGGGGGGGGGGTGGGSPLGITSSTLANAVTGKLYSTTLTATGGTPPYRWNLIGGSLPPGLNFTSNGLIEGFPTSVGSYTFYVQVIDSANPVHADARALSITTQAGSEPAVPVINRVKQKGTKKLWVFGQNFRSNSLVLVNGVVFQPVIFEQNGSDGQLLLKGKLNLGPAGTNIAIVVTGDNRSSPFVF